MVPPDDLRRKASDAACEAPCGYALLRRQEFLCVAVAQPDESGFVCAETTIFAARNRFEAKDSHAEWELVMRGNPQINPAIALDAAMRYVRAQHDRRLAEHWAHLALEPVETRELDPE